MGQRQWLDTGVAVPRYADGAGEWAHIYGTGNRVLSGSIRGAAMEGPPAATGTEGKGRVLVRRARIHGLRVYPGQQPIFQPERTRGTAVLQGCPGIPA